VKFAAEGNQIRRNPLDDRCYFCIRDQISSPLIVAFCA
jgi:hypothetical protein